MSELIKNIDVYILCGGLGKRLRRISKNKPKPMVKVGSKPFLDIIIDYMAGFGFKHFILGIGYKAEVFKKYYRNFKQEDLNIEFSEEKIPLGTGGAVKKAKRLIKSDLFLVLNGDSFCEFKPLDFLRFHRNKKASVSILLRKVFNGTDYGRVKLDNTGQITDFDEKDNRANNCFINAGIYIFDRNVFNSMPRKKTFSLELDFFPKIVVKNCFGYTKSGFFIDIGTPERYLKADKYFLKEKNNGRS
jgi:NDP-sugar pyrophosphorylase family protein